MSSTVFLHLIFILAYSAGIHCPFYFILFTCVIAKSWCILSIAAQFIFYPLLLSFMGAQADNVAEENSFYLVAECFSNDFQSVGLFFFSKNIQIFFIADNQKPSFAV